MSFEAAVHAKAIQLDQLVLDMCAEAGSGHPTSALSLGHIVTTLMYHSMRWTPEDPRYQEIRRELLEIREADTKTVQKAAAFAALRERITSHVTIQ